MLTWLQDHFYDLVDNADDWCNARKGAWWLRAALLAYLLYAGIRVLFSSQYRSMFSGLTFALHEMGHLMFQWFGQWIGIAGGTGLQLLGPTLAAVHLLWKQNDYFGGCVCACWLGFSLQEASPYIADARAQALPLISFSAHPIHDWNYLLSSMGLLRLDTFFAGLAYWTGTLVWALGCAAAGWLCWRIREHESERQARRHV